MGREGRKAREMREGPDACGVGLLDVMADCGVVRLPLFCPWSMALSAITNPEFSC
jgi:hypothetical protein